MPTYSDPGIFPPDPGEIDMTWEALLFRAQAGRQVARYATNPKLLREWLYRVADDMAQLLEECKEASDARPR